MRIYMQTPAMDNKPPRFYHLHIQEDLLEGWTLITETGYQGVSGRVKKIHFSQRNNAVDTLIRMRDIQSNKGYRTVFSEGVILE
ncbi:MAG TPA: hypothetical protein ENI64_07710 [Gammaproteobacteria bacterium]|nr:hypothetical protein [Gammaproteobacteria bacterium]